jgi:hypothetical protein
MSPTSQVGIAGGRRSVCDFNKNIRGANFVISWLLEVSDRGRICAVLLVATDTGFPVNQPLERAFAQAAGNLVIRLDGMLFSL